MNISANSVRFDDVTMWVELTDGRTVGVPLAWFPVCCTRHRLSAGFGRIGATGQGLHWEDLDEDISLEGLLAGRGDTTVRHSVAA